MVTTQRSTPETCAYCDARVDGEHDYRRHLNATHEPGELGAIDTRRYHQYRPEPNAVVKAGGEVASSLDGLHYPVEGSTVVRYGLYGALSSLFVAALLGVGL